MKSVKAIIRPEKVFEVMEKLSDAGFHAVTRMTILGRGKQRGLKVGNVHYRKQRQDHDRRQAGHPW